MTLSLFITRPLPGISFSVVSEFRVMTTSRKMKWAIVLSLTCTNTHTLALTFLLLGYHRALVLSRVELLQDLHQLSDAGGEPSGGQTKIRISAWA